MKLTVTITPEQAQALKHVMADPQEWIQNVIAYHAYRATEEIVQRETARMIADPTIAEIPASADEIVMAAALPLAPPVPPPL